MNRLLPIFVTTLTAAGCALTKPEPPRNPPAPVAESEPIAETPAVETPGTPDEPRPTEPHGLGEIGGQPVVPADGVGRAAPQVPEGQAQLSKPTLVAGELDLDVLNRIARQRLNAIKYCYEQRLRVTADLAGAVTVQATLDDGIVTQTTVTASTIGDENVERCIAAKVRRWRAPAGFTGTFEQEWTFAPDEG